MDRILVDDSRRDFDVSNGVIDDVSRSGDDSKPHSDKCQADVVN